MGASLCWVGIKVFPKDLATIFSFYIDAIHRYSEDKEYFSRKYGIVFVPWTREDKYSYYIDDKTNYLIRVSNEYESDMEDYVNNL